MSAFELALGVLERDAGGWQGPLTRREWAALRWCARRAARCAWPVEVSPYMAVRLGLPEG